MEAIELLLADSGVYIPLQEPLIKFSVFTGDQVTMLINQLGSAGDHAVLAT